MKKYDLSILIPARNEMFLSRTILDILEHKEGNTEIIAGLDGEWADPGIDEHPDVTLVYYPESIGQRGMTNQLCKLSRAKYVAKVDAHTAYDQGFDVKLMKAMEGHDDWTVVPIMRNLHAFNWVCEDGHDRYQGPSGVCMYCSACKRSDGKCDHKDYCGKPTTRDIVWIPKKSPQSRSFRFDKTLHFQYFGEFSKRPEGKGDITPCMSLQGSFFMLTRDKYWELNICDEAHGSWGQQGVEVACKTWLSGGEVMCIQTTWYAHMFRTQGGDFGFPYPNPGISKAREYSRALWFGDKWPLAIHPLSWLLEKFAPVPDWSEADIAELKGEATGPTKGMLYFTDNRLTLKYARPVQRAIRGIAAQKGMELVSSSIKPMDKMGKNVVTPEPRGYLTMFKQILKGLEAMTSDIVFMVEHDVLYPPEHFDFTPPEQDRFYYDHNWWKIHPDGYTVSWEADQVSGLCAYREALITYYRDRVATFDRDTFDRKFEPFSGVKSESWKAARPHIDIRTGYNLTKNKRTIDDFRDKRTAVNLRSGTVDDIPGWTKEQLSAIL